MMARKYKWWFSEFGDLQEQELLKAFRARDFTYGFNCQKIEERFASLCDRKFAVVTNSGTSAIALALLASERSGTALVPELGWIATPQAAKFCGLDVVFVDVEESRPIMALDQTVVKQCNASVAIPVHYNGRLVDVDRLKRLLKNSFIVEDCCKAMFSENGAMQSGSVGDVACYSFGMISLLSATYGGIATTDDQGLYDNMRVARNHGVKSSSQKFQHEIYHYDSLNFKPSGLLSSIALAALDSISARKQYLASLKFSYVEVLSNFDPELVYFLGADDDTEIPLLMDIWAKDRSLLQKLLADNDIETMRYHPPMSSSQAKVPAGKNSQHFYETSLHLPSGIFRKDLDASYFAKLKDILDQYVKSAVL